MGGEIIVPVSPIENQLPLNWDETVISILGNPYEKSATNKVSLHQGHLGWNKNTNQQVYDPTIHPMASDPQFNTLEADKLALLDTSRLIYRSGYRQNVKPRLSPKWLDEVNDSNTPVYGVIQFNLPFDTDARMELEAAGVQFYDYVDEGGLYCKFPASALSLLKGLYDAKRVLYAGPIPPEAKIAPELLVSTDTTALNIIVALFDLPTHDQTNEIQQLMTIEGSSLHPTMPLLRGHTPPSNISTIAGLPYVRWIELDTPIRLSNLESTMTLGSDVLRSANPNTTGSGVQVAILDSGIAQHGDLPDGRILDQHEFYPADDDTADDLEGHGTHVAGTIGGEGILESAWQGHAPDADFLVYKLCCDGWGGGYPPEDIVESLVRGGDSGMDVVNLSAEGEIGVYNIFSEIADRAVRGEYGDRYVSMVIAAGNENALVSSPGTSKNAITVGAVKDGNWPDELLDHTVCFDMNWWPGQRACFSNIHLFGTG